MLKAASLLVLVLTVVSPALAQVYDTQMSAADNIVRNRVYETGNLSAQAMAQQLVLGQQKISNGRASTRFAAAAANSIVHRAPAGQKGAIEAAIAAFNRQGAAFGLAPNDLADGYALALVMGYHAFRGEDPGRTRLMNVRTELKTILLKDAHTQGQSEQVTQQKYEYAALLAMSGLEARRAGDETRAREFGAAAVKIVWHSPIEGIELTPSGFGDRGDRLAASGGGSTKFARLTNHGASLARLSSLYPGLSQSYLQSLPERFATQVRDLGGSVDDIADNYTAIFALLAKTRNRGVIPPRSTLDAARAYLRKDFVSDANWLRVDDVAKNRAVDDAAFYALYLADSFANENPNFSSGYLPDAAARHLKVVFKSDFLNAVDR